MPSLRALLDSGRHEVVAVLTRPDAPRRPRAHADPVPGRRGWPTRPACRCSPRRRRPSPSSSTGCAELAPDCCPVVAYGALVPRAALDVPRARLGQPALLAAAGVARRGAGAGRDAARRRDHRRDHVPAGGGPGHRPDVRRGDRGRSAPTDTAGALLDRLATSGAALLLATMDGIADGTLIARPQPADGVSHAPKVDRRRTPGSTGPRRPTAVDRLIRSVTPEPGAWTTFRGERLGLGPVAPGRSPTRPSSSRGSCTWRSAGCWSGTATGPVRLGEVRRGRQAADAGARLGPRGPHRARGAAGMTVPSRCGSKAA